MAIGNVSLLLTFNMSNASNDQAYVHAWHAPTTNYVCRFYCNTKLEQQCLKQKKNMTFFPIYLTWIAHNTKKLHSIKLKRSAIEKLNCHEINKTLNKLQWQLNWPFLWFFNQAYCFDYLWNPGYMSPQHGSASSIASIFPILTITISNHCYAPTKASNTSYKKSLLEVFTILCTNLQLACKALKKKQ